MINSKIFQTDEIKINYDNRGYFFESFRSNSFKEIDFVQDNISFSIKYPQTFDSFAIAQSNLF